MKINDVEFHGQGSSGGLTYNIAVGTLEGDAVTLTAAGTMGRGADGGLFEGVLVKLEKDGKGTVAQKGLVHPVCVSGLTVGRKGLVVDGAGKVKAGSSGAGRVALVIGVQGTDTAIDLG